MMSIFRMIFSHKSPSGTSSHGCFCQKVRNILGDTAIFTNIRLTFNRKKDRFCASASRLNVIVREWFGLA